MKNWWRGLLLVPVVILSVSGVWLVVKRLAEPPVIAALPSSASDVRTSLVEYPPDYILFVKARISPEGFTQYIESLELSKVDGATLSAEERATLQWNLRESPRWWDCSDEVEGTFLHISGKLWIYAKLEEGHVYLIQTRI